MICSFHDKCSLRITPKIFIQNTFSMLRPLKVAYLRKMEPMAKFKNAPPTSLVSFSSLY